MHAAQITTTIINSRTVDHRTQSTQWGGPASRYRRVERPRRRGVTTPNYAARRLAAVFVAVGSCFVVASLANSLLVSFGGSPASAAEAAPAGVAVVIDAASGAEAAPIRHVARAGDSLWSIADTYRGEVDRDRYVDALVQLNGHTTIVVGQAVLLP